jgi:SAM-dependent methyltransferase
MDKKIKLDTERMIGKGSYIRDNFQVNFLYGLNDLCEKYVKDDFEILELGCNNGVSSSLFSFFAKKVICVDMIETEMMSKLVSENPKIEFHNLTFNEFLIMDNENTYDLIYIDGEHTFESVFEDIKNYKNKVKPGGFLCGHDFIKESFGVEEAIKKHFPSKEIIIFSDSSWLIKMD